MRNFRDMIDIGFIGLGATLIFDGVSRAYWQMQEKGIILEEMLRREQAIPLEETLETLPTTTFAFEYLLMFMGTVVAVSATLDLVTRYTRKNSATEIAQNPEYHEPSEQQ